ncbi:MBL fold metallo-hydrolase [Gammaproteobacteria bacterium 45_16_T64]|nr:MBL fold metallo-hydrolase [Gammaproteobacteria bacterium 45_16_T64]
MKDIDIIRIPILPMGMVNAYLVASTNGYILVDAGIPNSENKIGKALKRHGLTFRDIKLIVITHAHADHAGSAYKIQKYSRAPIVAHEADLPYYLREKAMTYCTTGWFGRFFIKTGIPLVEYEKFIPDILLKGTDSLDLAPFGVNGAVFSTPGHTQGSISIMLSNKKALVGDLVSSGILLGGIIRNGTAMPPPFEDSSVEIAKELSSLLVQGVETFYMGHGGPLAADEVRRYSNRILHGQKN